MSDREVRLRDVWREIEYEELSRRLAETQRQLAAFDERTTLLSALRRVEAERARLLALLGELST